MGGSNTVSSFLHLFPGCPCEDQLQPDLCALALPLNLGEAAGAVVAPMLGMDCPAWSPRPPRLTAKPGV